MAGSPFDAFYYATVSVTTTGYGDIVPVSEAARLWTTVVVTPARVLFLIILVGTTLELLDGRYRSVLPAATLEVVRAGPRDRLRVRGEGARRHLRSCAGRGPTPGRSVVIIDHRHTPPSPAPTPTATPAIVGNASDSATLREAGIADARAVVVAPSRDDAAVLITLTAREPAPKAFIAAAAREAENAHLLRQGGADSVISSSDAAGRLLGLATRSPRVVNVLEDLLSAGEGLDIIERPGRARRGLLGRGPARQGAASCSWR